jgi:hypothetical protein
MHEGDNPSFLDEFIKSTFFLTVQIHIRIFKQVFLERVIDLQLCSAHCKTYPLFSYILYLHTRISKNHQGKLMIVDLDVKFSQRYSRTRKKIER